MSVVDLDALAGEMNEAVGDLSSIAAVPTSDSPYFFLGDDDKLLDPLADPKTPDWVRAHACAIPMNEDKTAFAAPYDKQVVLDLLMNVKAGDSRTMLAKIFPHGSVRRKSDGGFRTVNVSQSTVDNSLVMVIPGFDATQVRGGIETAQLVPMKTVAKKNGNGTFEVNAHHMACRVKVNTDSKTGAVVDFMIMAGCELAVRDRGSQDSVWIDATCSVRTKSLKSLTFQAKQLIASIRLMTWVNLYRQQLADGVAAEGDVYHTALVRLSTNYFGMPYGSSDKKGQTKPDGSLVIQPRIHARLLGVEDPEGRARDLPENYVWKGFSGVFA